MATATAQPKPDWWPKHLLDEKPTAKLLGLPVETLRDWRCRKTRDLPYIKLGARVNYDPDRVWAWLCKNTVQAASD